MEIEGYCLKCKVKRKLSNARVVTLKNGRPAAKGNCPVCGRNVMTFLSAREGKIYQRLDKRNIEKSNKEGVKRTASMRIVHCIPGRVRFKLSPESPQPNLGDFLMAGVKEVAFTSITKSLLIIYDAEMLLLEDLLSGIDEKIPQLSWRTTTTRQLSRSTTTGQMRVVREEQETAEEAKEEVTAKTTGGITSAASLFPFSVMALGLVMLIGIDPPVVPGYALMWLMFLSGRRFGSRD